MLINITIAAVLMLATTVIHAGGMQIALGAVRNKKNRLRQHLCKSRPYSIGEVIIVMFNVSLLEVLLWGAVYAALNALDGFEHAFYFSMVTYTTLGYGDIVLDEHWRLLSSFQAANGIIMFGWTTAIVLYAVQHVYAGEESAKDSEV